VGTSQPPALGILRKKKEKKKEKEKEKEKERITT
jgi:hypothetical protein